MIKSQDAPGLSSLLSPENIFYPAGIGDRAALVSFLASKVHPRVSGTITEKALVERLMEVEKLNNVLETGLYIPHAKMEDLSGFYAVMAVLPGGMKDPASAVQVRAALLLLSPGRQAFFQQHLNLLAAMARTFQPQFIDRLCALSTGAAAAALFPSPGRS